MADREFINKRNQHGFSALHEAAINGRARAVVVRPRVPRRARRQTMSNLSAFRPLTCTRDPGRVATPSFPLRLVFLPYIACGRLQGLGEGFSEPRPCGRRDARPRVQVVVRVSGTATIRIITA
jgi:hypothetical protein